MPTIPSIRTSVENQSVMVLEENAKNGIFRRDARGRLIAYAGGFSVVFPYVDSSGEKWAFRCWHSNVNNSKKRYEIISDAIRKSQLGFLCDFIYVEKGINVDGEIYPTTRMRWIDGVTIKEYICQNRKSKRLLRELANEFLKMTQALHDLSLAHGDLQHGNILIDENHRLYLVDYDSFYCPKLKGEPDNVTGLPDYQHPARSSNKSVSEKIDYFSELIIYLSILAISKNSSLIDKYQIEGSERLLFAKEDFENLHASQIYQDISSLGDECKELLSILDEYLSHKDINELCPFTDYLLSNKVSFSTTALKAKRNTQQITVKWDIPFKAKVKLIQDGEVIPQDFKVKGQYSTTLNDSSDFCLIAETKAGQLIEKKIKIEVFDECSIHFESDKTFIFPSVPVTLSWNVTNAKRVTLDSKLVEHTGTLIVEPNKDTTYILKAKDEFDTKERKIEIKMLPIPQIKSLLVPTPNIVSKMALTIKKPELNVEVKIPEIEIGWAKTDFPFVPSLTDLEINAEVLPIFQESIFVDTKRNSNKHK